MTLAWGLLIVAGIFEIVWAVGLKYTQGFTQLIPTTITLLAMLISISCLGLAVKQLPIGTAYAVWTGIGAIGTAIFGIILLNESASPARLACIMLIALGILGLKLTHH